MKNVFAIVVTYNGEKWINKCIDSLLGSVVPISIIVVDNDSTDKTKELLINYPNVDLIALEKNSGFGKANNVGIKIALKKSADYIFLLNQDAWIQNDTIGELLDISESNPEYGVLSPIHLNGNYTGLDLNFSKQVAPELCPMFYSDMYVRKLKDVYELKFVNAAAWLISSQCVRTIGLFEPLFFLYGEDNNYLQRVSYHGFKIGVTPACTICHDREIRGGSFSDRRKALWERTHSLILLLDINIGYAKAVVLFLSKKSFDIIRFLTKLRFTDIRFQVKELLFLLFNSTKLYKIRKSHQRVNHEPL